MTRLQPILGGRKKRDPAIRLPRTADGVFPECEMSDEKSMCLSCGPGRVVSSLSVANVRPSPIQRGMSALGRQIMEGFVKIAKSDEIQPGQGKMVEVNGKKIALFNARFPSRCSSSGKRETEYNTCRFHSLEDLNT